MSKKIYLNGRFLTQALTGVQRTAYELTKSLDDLITQGMIDNSSYIYEIIYSGVVINPIELKNIKIVKKGFLKGNLWEQIELPIYTAGHLLISMCTITTLFKRDQILIVHDASFLVNPGFFPKIFRTWYKFAIPLLGKIVKELVTVSEFSKAQLVEFAGFKSKKVTVISNAADHLLRFSEPEDSFKQRIGEQKPYILAVSSLSENKNFKVIGAALEKLNLFGYQILIAGAKMNTLQESTPDTNVNYLGYVSNAELKYLYENATLFIFPSLYEGFGIPPLEAMICGCPVLSSNTSSLPEILGDGCIYFNPTDANDLANKLKAILNDKQGLESLVRKGLLRAQGYAWKNSGLKLHALATKLK